MERKTIGGGHFGGPLKRKMLYEAWPVWNPCPSPENGKTLEEKNFGGEKLLERKTSQDLEDLEVCILQGLSVQGTQDSEGSLSDFYRKN